MSASACTYPLDLARGRISGKLASEKVYGGIIQTVVLTVKDEGALALCKNTGVVPYCCEIGGKRNRLTHFMFWFASQTRVLHRQY
jgi:hypothetical protein